MPVRDAALQDFLTSLSEAVRARAPGADATAAMDRIDAALLTPGRNGAGGPRRLKVCDHLAGALATARTGSAHAARVANAFEALEPRLAWAKRAAGGPHAGQTWPDGHANTLIVGPNGLEDRDDLSIGASLLAPHVRYPDHHHGPEEVYLVLSRGRFQHGASDWFEPGLGGTLYNVPNIRHAMASDDQPLFAIWCLWGGNPA